jgi:NAD(P)-dependent dehydrogenase (short-subunit alcohol dehydrogenase family)
MRHSRRRDTKRRREVLRSVALAGCTHRSLDELWRAVADHRGDLFQRKGETANIIYGEGGKAEAIQADASKAPEMARTGAACLDRFGHIDVLDNNVGAAEVGGVVEVSEEETWDRVFAVNLKSCFLGMT